MTFSTINNLLGGVTFKAQSRELSKTFERLSSGLRINRASDDPAGLALSTKLFAEARIERQGMRNVDSAATLFNVAGAALDALSEIVTRQLELAQQAANESYTAAQRGVLDDEANALRNEYNRIVQSTEFNSLDVFEDIPASLLVQAGGSSYALQGTVLADLVSSVTMGDGTFQAGVTLASGGGPRAVFTGDFNGDGALDIVSADESSAQLRVFFGNGDGTFNVGATLTTGSNPYSVVGTDVNEDGILDIVSADANSSRLSIFLGNGNGTFKAATTLATGTSPRSVVAADLNGDGFEDLVSADLSGNRLSVFLGNGNGTFKAVLTLQPGNTPRAVIVRDVNNDGFQDLVTAGSSGNYLSVFLGNGNGTFKAHATISGTANIPLALASADVNEDGFADLIAAGPAGAGIALYLGNGNGTFKAGTSFVAGNPDGITTSDLNGDGNIDIVAANGTKVSILFGNGDGTFKAEVTAPTGSAVASAAVGDFDGDGIPDIVSAQQGSSFLSIFFQDTTVTSTNTGVLQGEIDLTTAVAAGVTQEYLQSVSDVIAGGRATVAANLSRLEVTLSNLTSTAEAFEVAGRRIVDADIAAETAKLVRLQIVQQAGVAVFAQANLHADLVLSLLKDE